MKKVYGSHVYRGPINNLTINETIFNTDTNEYSFVFQSSVLKKDRLFYLNRFGKFISLDFLSTELPTREEAEDFLVHHYLKHVKNPESQLFDSCFFYDPSEFTHLGVWPTATIKQLKKEYNSAKRRK